MAKAERQTPNLFHKVIRLTEREKDRDSRKTNYGSTWTSLLNSLSHLAMAEKMYASLRYLGQKKWFSGREQSQKKGFELFGSTSTKVPQVPPLHQWLLSFKAALVSKFSLYFNETLSKQSSPPEMKTLLAKTSCDYMARFATSLRKSDVTNLSIVLDTRGLEKTYKGHGYHHPAAKLEPPKGLDSYPAIVSVPGERPKHHWPNLIMIMNNNAAEMNTMERIVYFHDKAFQSTYYMIRIEPKMTLVVIFETKRAEKDSYVRI
ncbi:PREDICTED: UPF0536 protein C12orf66 homolog [Branchiostoma belcheri]|uniref:UPF0536 protein C12orf66 homolog n=1 Tax=Branchiostoma belcheri TaxID=7741 RepID=A0A6P5A3Z1_BRABE|nr:PREDICTED: UPF0536 protein C12orf66 homolog [Branchiostoma belcheri]